MNTIAITPDITNAVVAELGHSPMFKGLEEQDLRQLAANATMLQCELHETVMEKGQPSDSFFFVISGEAVIKVPHGKNGDLVEIARARAGDTLGELGVLLDSPRSATVTAGMELVLLKFGKNTFESLLVQIPRLALLICRVLARRSAKGTGAVPLPQARGTEAEPDDTTPGLLPIEFIQRHRVLPLRVEGNILHIGFVEAPTPKIISLILERLPGMQLNPVAIDATTFDKALQIAVGARVWTTPAQDEEQAQVAFELARSPRLDELLKRMVAEGASDIHLSACQKPRWRIDGVMIEMADVPLLGPVEVLDLIKPVMADRNRAQFDQDNDTDFAYAIPDLARFRVNVFRDQRGVGAVLRQIPNRILSLEQLGLPASILQICDIPKGLILVTGPTGSGKSTTLAAIIDHLNRTREEHIVTLEDPIEFVHESINCLVNQREVGPHTSSFARALRAALREDPDIVLVGEMRDLETIALALETANTGHLVFGTLHTNTAISTVSRVIDMFPGDQQNQIRTVLADTLKGVVAQTLCRRTGGGRVAALEVLVPDVGMASLIRDGKPEQLMSAMQMGQARGNMMLNNELVRLVTEGVISEEEATNNAVDKVDLAKRLNPEPDRRR